MGRRPGTRLLRWAQGPGRESGSWLLVAAAVAAIPLLNGLRAPCSASCEADWARLFFLPNLLFAPALLATALLAGSWVAQRLHGRTHKKYHARLEDRETPETPPGHFRPAALEHDLLRRSFAWMGLGALGCAGLFGYATMTRLGRRTCDPWQFGEPTGLAVCNSPSGWSDMLMAYQIWIMLALSALTGLIMLMRSRRFVARKEKRRFGLRRAQGHP